MEFFFVAKQKLKGANQKEIKTKERKKNPWNEKKKWISKTVIAIQCIINVFVHVHNRHANLKTERQVVLIKWDADSVYIIMFFHSIFSSQNVILNSISWHQSKTKKKRRKQDEKKNIVDQMATIKCCESQLFKEHSTHIYVSYVS